MTLTASTQAYWEAIGPADGRPIIFLHGVRESRAMWREQAPLADEHRLITADLPAHGALAGERFRLERAVERIASVVDEAAGGRALVVGFSLGGYVAMELAAQSPERVAGLVLCGASSEPWTVLASPLRIAARLLLAMDEGVPMPWAAAMTGRAALGRRLPPADPQAARRVRIDAGGQALLDIAGRRFRPRLRSYPGPALLVNGARDRLMRRHELAFLGECRQGRLVVVPNARHLANLDAPEIFNRHLRGFAASVPW